MCRNTRERQKPHSHLAGAQTSSPSHKWHLKGWTSTLHQQEVITVIPFFENRIFWFHSFNSKIVKWITVITVLNLHSSPLQRKVSPQLQHMCYVLLPLSEHGEPNLSGAWVLSKTFPFMHLEDFFYKCSKLFCGSALIHTLGQSKNQPLPFFPQQHWTSQKDIPFWPMIDLTWSPGDHNVLANKCHLLLCKISSKPLLFE